MKQKTERLAGETLIRNPMRERNNVKHLEYNLLKAAYNPQTCSDLDETYTKMLAVAGLILCFSATPNSQEECCPESISFFFWVHFTDC